MTIKEAGENSNICITSDLRESLPPRNYHIYTLLNAAPVYFTPKSCREPEPTVVDNDNFSRD